MSDEDGQRSRRSSMSDASIGSNQSAFARDIEVMADKVDAADALAKLAKDKYLAANQEHKGYSTALNNKLKDQKKLKAEQATEDKDDAQVVADTGKLDADSRKKASLYTLPLYQQ